MPSRYIGAREANQQFSALIKQVEDDDITIVITRRGQPVVQMTRVQPARDADAIAERMAALFATFSRPMHVDGINRKNIHDRDGVAET